MSFQVKVLGNLCVVPHLLAILSGMYEVTCSRVSITLRLLVAHGADLMPPTQQYMWVIEKQTLVMLSHGRFRVKIVTTANPTLP